MLVSQSCPTLCDPINCSPPGFTVLGILQARMLEWVAISPLGDLPEPAIKPGSPAWQEDSLPSEPPGKHPDPNPDLLNQNFGGRDLVMCVVNEPPGWLPPSQRCGNSALLEPRGRPSHTLGSAGGPPGSPPAPETDRSEPRYCLGIGRGGVPGWLRSRA